MDIQPLDIHPAGQYQAVSPRSVQPPCGGIRACACIFILRTRGGDDEGVGVWIFDKTAKISTENRFRPASVWGRQFNDIGGEGWGYLSLSLFLFIPRQSMRKQLEGCSATGVDHQGADHRIYLSRFRCSRPDKWSIRKFWISSLPSSRDIDTSYDSFLGNFVQEGNSPSSRGYASYHFNGYPLFLRRYSRVSPLYKRICLCMETVSCAISETSRFIYVGCKWLLLKIPISVSE